jgi:2-keto-3-deoxy-L-rhamnonate aldolase RhmA
MQNFDCDSKVQLILITKDTAQAQAMVKAGVDRIMVDLEINGKEDRQRNLNTVISRHCFQDISAIRQTLDESGTGALMVRINPIGPGSQAEIEEVLARGADRIMLPMFTHPDEVAECINLISGRAPLTLLLETTAALVRLPQILAVKGIDDLHFGLNDLHLDMGLDFMFELFGSGLLEHAARLIRAKGLRFGIGGVACIGKGRLPAELILAGHIHLGSDRVILSRGFIQTIEDGGSAKDEIHKLRTYLARKDLNLTALRQDLNRIALQIANENRSAISQSA